MRLRLTAVALAGGIATAPTSAGPLDPEATRGTLRVYADDDHVVVLSPSVAASTALDPATSIAIDVAADAVSGASVDVLSSASPVTVRELRVELGGRIARALGTGGVMVAGDARVSHERDHDAARAGATLRTELTDRNLVLDLQYRIGLDLAADVAAGPGGRRISHQLLFSASQLLGQRTVADLIIDVSLAAGYQASPYRHVPLVDSSWPLPTWVAEQTPDQRRAVTVAGRLRRALTGRWFVTAGQRFYADDWDLTSHTTTLDVSRQVSPRWLLGLGARGYLQDGADFYRSVYVATPMPVLRTRDRTLGPMRSLYTSLTVDRTLGERPTHLVVACGAMSIWYLDSTLQARRQALVTTVSWTSSF